MNMSIFQKKVRNLLPVLKGVNVAGRATIKKYYGLINEGYFPFGQIEIPYIKEIISYLTVNNGILGKIPILVTDNVNVAIKAAAYINSHKEAYYSATEYDDCLYDYDFEDDEDEEVDTEGMVRVINMGNVKEEPPAILDKYYQVISEISQDEMALFINLTDEEIGEKLDAISACNAANSCIHITYEQLNKWWVKEAVMNYNCEIVKLPVLDNDYYKTIVDYLFIGENITLSKEIKGEKLVQLIQKNQGERFKEEDIAWYLDEGLKNAIERGSDNVLKLEDFAPLLGTIENPVEKLNKMTGLKELKKVAKEMAAVAREEMVNDRLGVLHNNMIFVGNPGTGKTTGAKILADIMAWEGRLGAKVVVADRRNIIGKYVGHTAPKVAKLFEEAKGGVLFVDEAGFFLNRNSGGYVDEAIKEFVRYMEMFPQVTVIFAMYSKEMKGFLELDSGLASRINKVVKFEDYTIKELVAITEGFIREKGYRINKEATERIRKEIQDLKDSVRGFDNARGARNLAYEIILSASIRKYEHSNKSLAITLDDVINGCKRMKTERTDSKRQFGFTSTNYMSGVVENKKLQSAF